MTDRFYRVRKYLVSLVILVLAIIFVLFIFLNRHEYKINNLRLNEDGAWCWFQDPRAVYYSGLFSNTYTGWVDKTGDIIISSYNSNTKLSTSTILHRALQIDDHSAPSILVRPDGHLMVFYSSHNGDAMYHRVSVNPEDVSLWGDEQSITTNTIGGWGYTYPNPIQLAAEGNKIYLFWRGGNGEPTFSTSLNGESWSDAQTLFNVPSERPYMKVFSNGTDKIYFTFTDGHPNEVDNNSIYFTYYKNGAFYKANDDFIKKIEDLPLLPSDLDIVYDSKSTGIKAWNWDISFDKFGYPIIVYVIFPSTNDHRYMYSRWNGKSWDNNEIIPQGVSLNVYTEPYYSGGITLDHENPSNLYISREINGIHEIEKWITTDGGFRWSHSSITSDSTIENIRPLVPVGYNLKGPEVLWLRGGYDHYTDYSTQIMTYIKK